MASKREGLSLAGFFQRFPDDAAAEVWFTERRWPDDPERPHCASTNIATVASRKPMPFDESYVGGLNRNRHKTKRRRLGGGSAGKTPIIGIVDQPTNRIAAMPVDRIKTDIVAGVVKQHVAAGAAVYVDRRCGFGVDRRLARWRRCGFGVDWRRSGCWRSGGCGAGRRVGGVG